MHPPLGIPSNVIYSSWKVALKELVSNLDNGVESESVLLHFDMSFTSYIVLIRSATIRI